MKKLLLTLTTLTAFTVSLMAIDNNTVEIVYHGSTATVNVAENISQYVTVSSGTSSDVIILQDVNFEGTDITAKNTTGEITYVLSGISPNGSFTIEGVFKQTIELNDLTLNNPYGPAINIQNGKRTNLSVKSGTTNVLSDGVDTLYNGCIHCKGHLKIKGKGTLNLTGNNRHALYSKEYMEVKNCTLNIESAAKDGIHCKEYFLMESGVVNIANTGDDGIQVELSSNEKTGITTDHEDENTGNFYMSAGTLTISSYQGRAIKADGVISYSGGTRNFPASDTEQLATIKTVKAGEVTGAQPVYNLRGIKMPANTPLKKGSFIRKKDLIIVK